MSSTLLDASDGPYDIRVIDKPVPPEIQKKGDEAAEELKKILGKSLITK